eukprot:6002309-Pleurochrysis_carterae.AAC.2
MLAHWLSIYGSRSLVLLNFHGRLHTSENKEFSSLLRTSEDRLKKAFQAHSQNVVSDLSYDAWHPEGRRVALRFFARMSQNPETMSVIDIVFGYVHYLHFRGIALKVFRISHYS